MPQGKAAAWGLEVVCMSSQDTTQVKLLRFLCAPSSQACQLRALRTPLQQRSGFVRRFAELAGVRKMSEATAGLLRQPPKAERGPKV